MSTGIHEKFTLQKSALTGSAKKLPLKNSRYGIIWVCVVPGLTRTKRVCCLSHIIIFNADQYLRNTLSMKRHTSLCCFDGTVDGGVYNFFFFREKEQWNLGWVGKASGKRQRRRRRRRRRKEEEKEKEEEEELKVKGSGV